MPRFHSERRSSTLLRAIRTLLATGTSLAMVLMPFEQAMAGGPTGGNVVAGQATISNPNSTTTLITQSTDKAVINWQDFSISAGNNATFAQPNSASVTLNRVTGGMPAVIDGSLFANGHVWLIDGNGVLFGKGAQVNVGSLIATTADINNNDFMNGNGNFSSASSNPNAAIVNNGSIKASSGGSIVLAGPVVQNNGLIQADLGHVVLAGADAFTVDFQGDNLIRFQVSAPVSKTPVDANGHPQGALVSNTGTVSANGGTVLMTARAAESVADNVINNTGVVEANSVKNVNGTIIFDAGDGGEADIGGTVSATGAAAGQAGGTVTATGSKVQVADNAVIDASGNTHGGTILIGGDIHGGATPSQNFSPTPIANAETTSVAKTAQITANSANGAGGNVVIWSNSQTNFAGNISAMGLTGGGFAEVSSHNLLNFTGHVDLTAPQGKTGTLLLDPYSVTVSSSTDNNNSCTSGTCSPSGTSSNLNVTTLEDALSTADVVVTTGGSGSPGSEAGDITVLSPVTWSANTLTLDAYHSIGIDATLSATGTAGLTLTTNDGGTGGVLSFSGGNVTFASTSEALTINGVVYTLLGSMADVQAINSGLSGNYALENSLDATGVSSWNPIGTDGAGNVTNSGNGFTGTFEGLGNKISNLTISDGTITTYVGLFGYSSGTIRDIGLVGGTVTGLDYTGALVGESTGAIISSYSTEDVSGRNGTGGLVGFSDNGSITESYATGAVSGAGSVGGLLGVNFTGPVSLSFATGNVTGSGDTVGGLVGYDAYGGSVSQSYAMGTVKGPDYLGGLVGTWSGGSGFITQSYSTGAVISTGSPSNIGGLLGYDSGATITSSYWDTETSGQSSSVGGGTGLPTLQLQSALPSGFSASAWDIVAGKSFPYLAWQIPNGTPQVVAGTVLSTEGGTAVVGKQISVLVDGTNAAVVSMGSGHNGYYYELLAPGSISGGGSQVLVYGSGAVGAALADGATSSVSGLDVYGTYLHEVTGAASYSTVEADLATAIGGDSAAQTIVDGLANLAIDATGTSFAIDDFLAGTTVDLVSAGSISESGGSITAGTLTGSSNGTVTLDGSNSITDLGAFSTGGYDFTLDNGALSITGALNASGSTVDLELGSNSLDENSGSGSITAATLTGSSGSTTLDGSNAIDTLGDYTSGGDFTLDDTTDLSITGALDATGNTVDLELGSNNLDENSGSGSITAATLTGNSGSTTLDGSNAIDTLGDYTSGGDFTLDDTTDLSITGALDATGNTVDLELGSNNVDENSGSGSITAATLTGSSGSTTLDGSNAIDTLGDYTSGGDFTLDDTTDLSITGALDATGNTVDLELGSNNVDENSGGGSITASELTGSSGSTTLDGSNAIDTLGDYISGGDFMLDDTTDLSITGALDATGNTVDLELGSNNVDENSGGGSITASELTGNSGSTTLDGSNAIDTLGDYTSGGDFTLDDTTDLSITGALDATGNTVDLELGSNNVDENGGGGSITAATLTGNSGSTTLDGSNAIDTLGDYTSGGDFTLDDTTDLSITGALDASGNTVDLELGSNNVDENSGGGSITASELTGNSGSTTLDGSNAIDTLGDYTSGGDFTLDDTTDLSITGALDASGNTVDLELGSNNVDENSGGGSITASELTGSSGSTTLDGSNAIDTLADYTSGGDFTLDDTTDLSITGTIDATGNTLTLNNSGAVSTPVPQQSKRRR